MFLLLALCGALARPTHHVRAQDEEPTEFVIPSDTPTATNTPELLPSPDALISEINSLRAARGIKPLSTHPALMKIAQEEANGIASGMPGHWRPYGFTLGQWMIMEGFALSGDLTQDGYRSENWSLASDAKGAIQQVHDWIAMDDEPHTNTMLSIYRSHIGAGSASFVDEWGNKQIVFVLETALQTLSGNQQGLAREFLTSIPDMLTQASAMDGTPLPLSEGQYIIPVARSTALPNGDVFHKVQAGQALWSIAIYYDTTIEEIRQLNHLGPDNTIYEGQDILVKRGATQPSDASNAVSTPAAGTAITPWKAVSATPTLTVMPVSDGGLPGSSGQDVPMVIGVVVVALAILGGAMAVNGRRKSD